MEVIKSDPFSVKELVEVMETPKIKEMELRLEYDLNGGSEELKEKEETYKEFTKKGKVLPAISDDHFTGERILVGLGIVSIEDNDPHRLVSFTSDYQEKMGIKRYRIMDLKVKYVPDPSGRMHFLRSIYET